MRFFSILVMVLAGFFLSIKGPINGRLRLAANAESFGQPIAAPVGRTVRRTLTRGLQDACLGLSGTGSALTTAITRIESRQTLLLKAPLPLPDILVTTI